MARGPATLPFTIKGDFASALDKVVMDEAFRDRLDRTPVEALDEIGIEIASPTKAALVGKRLAELVPLDRPGHGPEAHVAVLVVVGVAIGTNLSVDNLKDRLKYRRAVRAEVDKLTAGPAKTARKKKKKK